MSDAHATPTDAPASQVPPPPRPASRLALAAFLLAVAAALLAVLAGLGSRWGIWSFRTGFSLLEWAALGGLGVLALGTIAAYLTRPGTGRRGFPLALLALILALPVVIVPWNWRRTARSAPPIHDITTDPQNPPEFVAIAPLRADAPNPVEYAGEEVAAQQRQAYPDLRPLLLDLSPARAFQRALDTARGMGWEIVAADPDAGRIEATDRTRWFGFRDDVVIRLTPVDANRTVLDVRSKSRVGRGDAGTNARRVRDYLERVSGA